jgi:hypothetical protein
MKSDFLSGVSRKIAADDGGNLLIVRASPLSSAVSKKSGWFNTRAQNNAPTGAPSGAVKYSLGQKRYIVRYIYRVGKSARYDIARRNNYRFLQLQDTVLDRASAGGEYVLARKTWIECAAKRFYSAKI